MSKRIPLTAAERSARSKVGDGKLPNLYWVVVCSGWYEAKKEKDGSTSMEDSLDLYPKEKETKPVTSGPFPTFRKAEEAAERAIECDVVEPGQEGHHRVYIEDRLTGQVFEACWYVHMTQRGPYRIPRFDFHRHADLHFTQEEIEKKGGIFA